MQGLCLFRVVQGGQYVGDLKNVQAEGMYMQVCAAGLCRSCMHVLRRTTFIKDSANFGKVTDTLGQRSPSPSKHGLCKGAWASLCLKRFLPDPMT